MYRPVRERSREQIMEGFIVRAAPAERDVLQVQLEKMSLTELEQAYQVLQTQTRLQQADEELARIQVETEADRIWHQETMRLAREPQRKAEAKAQLQQDRETFRQAARQYGLSDIEANFNVVRSTLGAGFNVYQVGQAVSSNAVGLVPATEQELAQRHQEAQEERQDFLINQASPEELRQAARTEAEQRRIQAVQQETERQIAARETTDAAYGFTPIPEFNQVTGEKLDSAYFIKLSNTNISAFKQAIRRWGAANVTGRIRQVR
jgi:hypothetical protein